uniref:Uncharacterized protein n=1 Tax=Oryza brachyantha TaxID=4533 RepID=J3MS38_ORYBR
TSTPKTIGSFLLNTVWHNLQNLGENSFFSTFFLLLFARVLNVCCKLVKNMVYYICHKDLYTRLFSKITGSRHHFDIKCQDSSILFLPLKHNIGLHDVFLAYWPYTEITEGNIHNRALQELGKSFQ